MSDIEPVVKGSFAVSVGLTLVQSTQLTADRIKVIIFDVLFKVVLVSKEF